MQVTLPTPLALAMVFLSSSALATTYSDAVERQSKCEAAGKISQSSHGITQAELRSTVADLSKQMDTKKVSKKLGGDMQYLVWVGYSADSSTNAYMKGWAWCMDQK